MTYKVHKYLTSCVDIPRADVPDLEAMIDGAWEITLETFRCMCDCAEWEQRMGYVRWRGRGVTLRTDPHVRFFSSKYKGRPCYYVVHSAIEYIFAQPLPDTANQFSDAR